jgi:hypothetical protein
MQRLSNLHILTTFMKKLKPVSTNVVHTLTKNYCISLPATFPEIGAPNLLPHTNRRLLIFQLAGHKRQNAWFYPTATDTNLQLPFITHFSIGFFP